MSKKILVTLSVKRSQGSDQLTKTSAQVDYLEVGGQTSIREADEMLHIEACPEADDRLFLKNLSLEVEKRTGRKLKISASDVRSINEAISEAWRPSKKESIED